MTTSPLLFKYIGLKYGPDNLTKRRWRLSRISSFNDPFDFMPRLAERKVTVEEMKQEILHGELHRILSLRVINQHGVTGTEAASDYIRTNLDASVESGLKIAQATSSQLISESQETADIFARAVCFTHSDIEQSDEVLMWSHYGQSHEGIRVGFQFPQGLHSLSEVHYQEERVEVYLGARPASQPELDEALQKIMFTKSKAWDYEKEYRMLVLSEAWTKDSSLPPPDNEFLTIDPLWVVNVAFGAKVDRKMAESKAHELSAIYPHVEWLLAEYHPTEFSLVYKPLPKM